MTNEQTAEALDPSDVADVTIALGDAQAGDSQRQIDEAAQGYSPDPNLAAAISAGSGIAVTGVNADQSVITGTPQAVVAGSTQAAEVVSLTSLPIVGAGYPTVQTLSQLGQRFDGIAGITPDSTFPTAQ
jgi:hypothetical protein